MLAWEQPGVCVHVTQDVLHYSDSVLVWEETNMQWWLPNSKHILVCLRTPGPTPWECYWPA